MNMITTNNLTMSSLEISELVESRHDSVKRAIERLATRAVIELPPTVGVKNHLGQTVEVYVFSGEKGKRDSLVVVAQLSPEFTGALVDRWQELEQQVAKPQFKIPETLGDALQLAADLAKKVEQDKPKVEHYDRVADLDRTMNITMAATKLGMSARRVNQILDTLNVYNKSIVRARVFNQWFVDKGYGVVRQTSNAYLQSLLTIKGEIWLGQQLSELGLIPKNVKPLEIEHA